MPRPRTGTAYEKNGKWYIGVRLRDGRKWATPCPPREDGVALDHIHARSVAANLQRDYDHGRWDPEAVADPSESTPTVASPATPAAPVTVLSYAREWIKTQRYGSVEKDKKRIEFYLAPSPLASQVLAEVRPRHVLAFIGWLTDRPSARGGTLASRTIRNAYDVLRRALAGAVIADLIPSSPCAPLSNALPSMADKHPGARETWLFTREEVERLISAPELLPDRRVTYAILFLTGCRWGELAALRWRDWNPGAVPLGRLIISRAIEPMTKREKGTKTGAVKRVPVHPVLAEILTAWQARGFEALLGRAPTSEDFILPSRRFTARGVDSGNRYLHEDCALLKLVPRHIHCARRTFISLAQDDGGEPGKLKWITHAPPKAVFDQYTTLQWKTLCAEVQKLQITLARSADVIVRPTGGGGSAGSDRLATGLATEAGTDSAEGLVSSGLVTEAQRNRTSRAVRKAPSPPVLKTGPVTRPGRASGGHRSPPDRRDASVDRVVSAVTVAPRPRVRDHRTVRRSITHLCGAMLAVACASSRPSIRTSRAVEEPPSRTLHAPRTSCQPPHQPSLAAGYRVVRWPSSPRFSSVGSLGGALFATTTSSVCASSDGGLAWRPLLESLEFPTLLAMDEGAVIVREGIDPNGDAVPGAEVRWWISADGGERWRDQRAAPESVAHGATRVTLPRLGQRDAVTCGGVLFATIEREGAAPILIESLDGGERWRRARGVALPREGARVRCVASGFVMIERLDRMPVAFSRDAGASWCAVRPPPVIVPDERDVLRVERGCAPMPRRGLFCELYGQTWVSDDDGRRWHRGSSPVGGRSLVERGAQLVGVGGGVAESNDTGRRWVLRASGSGRSNLGLRGGIVSDRSYWLAGSALWWTDDAGERWSATLLSWELVTVLDRRRWVGFVPGPEGESCRGKVVTTVDGGRHWRSTLTGVVSVRALDGGLHATLCGPAPRYRVGSDGLTWRPSPTEAPTDDSEQEPTIRTGEGIVVRLEQDTLRAGEAVLASGWPRDIAPVVAHSRDGAVDLVVFGNGTVLRRAQ